MPLIVEDGTGVTGANAYVDTAFVTAYLADRARGTQNGWDAAAAASREAAIVKATDYIEARFGKDFGGERLKPDQGLSIPRLGLEVDGVVLEGVPLRLRQAAAEYAVRALAAELQPDPVLGKFGQVVSPGPVTGTRVKAGPVETETTFAAPTFVGERSGLTAYPAADLLIEPLLRAAGIFGRVVRA